MPLSPQDVVNKKFGQKLRGYDPDEVDAFLDEVEGELVRLLTDNSMLQQRLAAVPPPQAAPAPAPVIVPEPVVAAPPPPVEVPIAPGEPQEAALRTLLMAQRTADQAIAEARAEADAALAKAQEEADALLAAAQQRGSQLDQEINARTAAAMSELEGRRAELEKRIEELKAFEREYRLRLKAYLESQLKDLDGRTPDDDGPGAGVPAAARTAAVGPITTGGPSLSKPASEPDLPQVLPAEWAELHEGSETAGSRVAPVSTAAAPAPETVQPAPAGPPREAAPGLRAVPPLSDPDPVGPFTVVPPPVPVEQVDEGPEPSTT